MNNKKKNYFSHKTSIIDKSAKIGKATKIWHFSHVMKYSKIGSNCILGQNTHIGPNVKIGNNCKIQNNVSIYEGVVLKDKVFCGPSCVFTNVLNPRSELNRKKEFQKTIVETGTARGFSSICMSKALIDANTNGKIYTVDILPHDTKMYWNCIDDHDGMKSRKELLKKPCHIIYQSIYTTF